jgi:hypothetical protein
MLSDLDEAKLAIETMAAEFGVSSQLPDNVKVVMDAAELAEGFARGELLARALRKMQIHCLVHATIWTKGMTDDTKDKLKEYKREQKEIRTPVGIGQGPAEERAPPKPAPTSVKRSKVPLFNDMKAQQERVAKYPWVVAGSFREDPSHPGGTIADIKCQETGCTAKRTVHAGDLFQVKFCAPCKEKR